jgi:hypothetical protein
MSILGIEISKEVKQEEMHLNERIRKLTEQQLLAFRKTHLLATEKITAWIEIDHEWTLINGGDELFRKEEGKKTITYVISLLASALILYFLSISSTEKAVAFLIAVLWVYVLRIQDMNVAQNIFTKKAILNTALVNLRSEVRACGVSESTADSYRLNNKMCIESEGSSELIRRKFYNDYRLSKVNIQNDILNSM